MFLEVSLTGTLSIAHQSSAKVRMGRRGRYQIFRRIAVGDLNGLE